MLTEESSEQDDNKTQPTTPYPQGFQQYSLIFSYPTHSCSIICHQLIFFVIPCLFSGRYNSPYIRPSHQVVRTAVKKFTHFLHPFIGGCCLTSFIFIYRLLTYTKYFTKLLLRKVSLFSKLPKSCLHHIYITHTSQNITIVIIHRYLS